MCRTGTMQVPARCLLLVVVVVAAEAPPVVWTRHGAVQGREQTSSLGRQIYAFYNLPFAKPPVGELRFRDPQPPDEWAHVRDATAPGSDCIQNDNVINGPGIFGAEDCLYLNVFTPQLSNSTLLPVMFWIHGGAFYYGGAKAYGPDFLLNHDVVLVTTNYRLGIFGFLSTEDAIAPGNYGLKDQAAALRWVQENIAEFGGDPGSVTVFGESAGSSSAHLLAVSPLSKDLLHRVIMQSGSAFGTDVVMLKGVAVNHTRTVANELGCPTQNRTAMVDCLRGVENDQLLDSLKVLEKWHDQPIMKFFPVVERENEAAFLPEYPLYLIPNDIQWIIGLCENEGAFLVTGMYNDSEMMREFEDNFLEVLPITMFYDSAPNKDNLTNAIRNFYMPSGHISLRNLIDVYSDVYFYWGANHAVLLYKNTSSVFYYQFTYRGQYRVADPYREIDFDLGAGHTDDLFYIFPKNPFYPTNYDLPDEDMKVVQTMTMMWTDFARTGHPTPEGTPLSWPTVTSDDEPEYLDIGPQLSVKQGFALERFGFEKSINFIEEMAHAS